MSVVRQVERPAIPFERVQQALRTLLGEDVELRQLRRVVLHLRSVEVELYALDDQGRKFVRGADGEVVVDRIHIPIGRAR